MPKKRILVVDDNMIFLKLLRLKLESNNYEVITARDGKEALQKMKVEMPDAVLLDIFMPHMDGLQTLKKIRKIKKELPVFIITGFSDHERFTRANKLNASGFIVKSSDLNKEIKNITAILGVADKYK